MKIEFAPRKREDRPTTLGMLLEGDTFVFVGSDEMPVMKTRHGYAFLSDGSGQLQSVSNDARPVRRCVAKVVVESVE